MQFTYHENAKDDILIIEGELHKYLFKIRRVDSSKNIYFRNLQDNNIYEYRVENIDRRKTTLSLVGFEEKSIKPKKELHLGWCVIDPKSIEKYIASLNELGVTKITFIYCKFSQKQYKISFDKLEKLLINSSQQSGRSSLIKLEYSDSLEDFLIKYPNSYMFNFSKNNIDEVKQNIETIILGCEGGFSSDEVSKIKEEKIVGINSSLILRSETAALTIASKILV